MAKGTVKWFSTEKGYGFITPEHGGDDIFVHHSAIRGADFGVLAEGQRVQYKPTTSPKGPVAIGVEAL